MRPDQIVARIGQTLALLDTAEPAPVGTTLASLDRGGERLDPWDAREAITITPDGVALVPISGVLARGFDACTAWCFGIWRLEAIEAALEEIRTNTAITTAILDIDSPGGYTTGIAELGEDIAALDAQKPVFAWSAGMCCSAAYWLASQCRRIVSSRSADIGSVGTYCAVYDYSGYLEKLGVTLELFKAGDLKAIGLFGKAMTDEERAFLQASVDKTNNAFLAAVQAGRGDLAEADLQGQWFDGEDALAKGFVDANARNLGEMLAALPAARG